MHQNFNQAQYVSDFNKLDISAVSPLLDYCRRPPTLLIAPEPPAQHKKASQIFCQILAKWDFQWAEANGDISAWSF